jgi:hypothetical protein
MNISFHDSIENYLPVYFHFLDGFLNPNYGYKKNKLLNFLKNNKDNLIPQNISEIYYLDFNYDYTTESINLKFYNFKNSDTPIIISINKLNSEYKLHINDLKIQIDKLTQIVFEMQKLNVRVDDKTTEIANGIQTIIENNIN